MKTQIIQFIISAAVCFAATAVIARKFIPVLKSIKMGQKILDIGPRWHKSKEGTPTMGGLFFIIPILAVGIVFAVINKDYTMYIHLAFALLNGIIGFADDYVKFFKKQNAGLTPGQKLIAQFASAFAYIMALYLTGNIDSSLKIPFTSLNIEINIVLYCVIAVVGIVFTVNSVNLTDGIDGLASSITAVLMMFLAVLSLKSANLAGSVAAGAVIGGTLGFLVYNFHPAKVFMGDTGSLSLGAAISSMAFILDCPLILLFVGFMFYIEAFSVMIQVFFYKTTGKRVFKMTPIHHHFEMSGWSEVKIVAVFSLITALVSLAGCLGFVSHI
ncbi:MAG: phospho-N-acetylmuramoyl-pentapeptide-transferase [Clostridiales bacterium]|nr:phospho-N-acetylmuramoyl-pentapeptide-transferase [Clostridiales bacterium]